MMKLRVIKNYRFVFLILKSFFCSYFVCYICYICVYDFEMLFCIYCICVILIDGIKEIWWMNLFILMEDCNFFCNIDLFCFYFICG